MTPDERTRRAAMARNIWNDPVMKEARAHIEATLLERFKAAPVLAAYADGSARGVREVFSTSAQ